MPVAQQSPCNGDAAHAGADNEDAQGFPQQLRPHGSNLRRSRAPEQGRGSSEHGGVTGGVTNTVGGVTGGVTNTVGGVLGGLKPKTSTSSGTG